MNIRFEPELCQGAGICECICPQIFEMGIDGTAHLKGQKIPEKFEEACRKAANSCPTQAIIIEE